MPSEKDWLPDKTNSLSSNPADPQEEPDYLHKDLKNESHDLLYESIMKSGGQPFGQSLGIGITTLTTRTTRKFKQKGNFSISSFEKFTSSKRNRFTRAGSSGFQGNYPPEVIEWAFDPSKRPKQKWWKKLLGLK